MSELGYLSPSDARALDAYLTREPDFCDLEEYDTEYCCECSDKDSCEVYKDRVQD